jgi:hypothetical protein
VNVDINSGTRFNFLGSGVNPLSIVSFNFEFTIMVPIAGWDASLTVSDQSEGRVVAARISGDPASATSGNPVIFPTSAYDTHAAYNASTGRYTAPISGYYRVHGFITSANTGVGLSVYVDAASVISVGQTDSNGECSYTGSVFVNAGQIIDLRPNNTLDAGSGSTIHFERIAGNSTPFAQETIAASYHVSADFASSTTVPVNFDTKEFDTHGAVTPSSTAWKFTAPISGKYQVIANGTSATALFEILYKNGSAYKNVGSMAATTNGAGTVCTIVHLNAGDYIDLRPTSNQTVKGGTLSTAGVSNISIVRVGN